MVNDLGYDTVENDGVLKKTSETFVTVFGAKTGYTRSITILLMFCMINFVAAGSTDINYLFTRKMFDWNESQFTRVSTGATGKISLNVLDQQHSIQSFGKPDCLTQQYFEGRQPRLLS